MIEVLSTCPTGWGLSPIDALAWPGAYLELTGIVRHSSIIETFRKVFGTKARRLLPQNREALNIGAEIIHNQSPLPEAI